jgi:hypothetical protein
MSNPIYFPAWQRPHWQPSDEEIILHFYVFGDFKPIRVPSEPYGSDGLPEGMEVNSYHSALREWEGYPLKGSLGDLFKNDAPEAFEAATKAPQVLVVRGRFKDSRDTGYLRDTLACWPVCSISAAWRWSIRRFSRCLPLRNGVSAT